MLYTLATRDSEGISVIHDRNPIFVRLADGAIRNAYTVRILNKPLETRDVRRHRRRPAATLDRGRRRRRAPTAVRDRGRPRPDRANCASLVTDYSATPPAPSTADPFTLIDVEIGEQSPQCATISRTVTGATCDDAIADDANRARADRPDGAALSASPSSASWSRVNAVMMQRRGLDLRRRRDRELLPGRPAFRAGSRRGRAPGRAALAGRRPGCAPTATARRGRRSTRATRDGRPLAGLDAERAARASDRPRGSTAPIALRRDRRRAVSRRRRRGRRAMGPGDRTVARRRAAVPLAATASSCAEDRAMTETLDLSLFVQPAGDGTRAHGPRGRGRRLRRLHPQDRERPQAAARRRRRAAQLHQPPPRGRLARRRCRRRRRDRGARSASAIARHPFEPRARRERRGAPRRAGC